MKTFKSEKLSLVLHAICIVPILNIITMYIFYPLVMIVVDLLALRANVKEKQKIKVNVFALLISLFMFVGAIPFMFIINDYMRRNDPIVFKVSFLITLFNLALFIPYLMKIRRADRDMYRQETEDLVNEIRRRKEEKAAKKRIEFERQQKELRKMREEREAELRIEYEEKQAKRLNYIKYKKELADQYIQEVKAYVDQGYKITFDTNMFLYPFTFYMITQMIETYKMPIYLTNTIYAEIDGKKSNPNLRRQVKTVNQFFEQFLQKEIELKPEERIIQNMEMPSSEYFFRQGFDKRDNDAKILASILHKQNETGDRIILISNDAGARVRAMLNDIEIYDLTNKIKAEILYSNDPM